MNDIVIEERHGRVVLLTLNKPEVRNTLSTEEECVALAERFENLSVDADVSVLVLTGAGSCFSAGGDLRNMKERRGLAAGGPEELRARYRRGIQRLARSLHNVEVPTIAAVNGPASGAGFDLALMCDIRIAATAARFAESFVKVGLVPGDGGAWLLQRAVGFSRAAEMTFTGDLIDAEEAWRIGLVSRFVPDDELIPTALALAARIAKNPPQALRESKRLMREARVQSFAEHLESAAHAQARAHHTAEHEEAVSAFLEKRAPHFLLARK